MDRHFLVWRFDATRVRLTSSVLGTFSDYGAYSIVAEEQAKLFKEKPHTKEYKTQTQTFLDGEIVYSIGSDFFWHLVPITIDNRKEIHFK